MAIVFKLSENQFKSLISGKEVVLDPETHIRLDMDDMSWLKITKEVLAAISPPPKYASKEDCEKTKDWHV